MKLEQAYEAIAQSGVMVGLRGHFPAPVALDVARVVIDAADFRVFEFTTNSTDAFQAMAAVKHAYGDSVCAGMGTVLDEAMAQRALDAGADFVVAPSFSPAVVQRAHDAGILAIPGVITPTEAVNAWSLGVRLLKLFPIGPLGLDYFKALRGPLDHMNFLCNGGITDENVGPFLKAGAVGCGVMNWLTGDGSMPLEAIDRRARVLRQAVNNARSGIPQQRSV